MPEKLTEAQIRKQAETYCSLEREIARSGGRWPASPCPASGCAECRGLVLIGEIAKQTAAEIIRCFQLPGCPAGRLALANQDGGRDAQG